MNRREAKRQACLRAHVVILTALAGADADWLDGRYGEDDAEKVAAALNELAEELARRAGIR